MIERVNEASRIAPVTNDTAFGDQVSTFNGALSFRNTDVSISGNNALPVALTRRLDVDDRLRGNGLHIGGFAEWDIDLPQIYGVFTKDYGGWRPASGTVNQRCSLPDMPPSATGLDSFDFWDGYFLNTGASTSPLLGNPKAVFGASSSYKWITKDFWLISCKSATSNGYPGEAFIATSPSGIRYILDWVVAIDHPSVKSPYGTINGTSIDVRRQAIHFLVSRIEDRFGNWVNYSYSGSQLTSIDASDGRHIGLAWGGGKVTSVTADGRTWTYAYEPYGIGRLSSVTLPDGSAWGYTYSGSLAISPAVWTPMYEDPTGCPQAIEDPSGAFTISVTAPSRAVGVFQTELLGHYRTNSPTDCLVYNNSYWRLAIPDHSWSLTLTRKQISGPGMTAATWDYSYGNQSSFYPGIAEENTVTTTGKFIRYTYGTSFHENEGQLLRTDVGSAANDIKKSTTTPMSPTPRPPGRHSQPRPATCLSGIAITCLRSGCAPSSSA